ncbi:hypothetical protein [Myxococcus virescens]|uniref:Uncharacterized protein n=1 Tax=Myxococcus virescens TaxID=83456 RepID=A0A511HPJ9_9BACT|nr:hypothetical protein [Myxococcus virescens]GEL75522.1 hypothetical protein MVI01_73060 [Myxococcus virescens]SDD65597.1 hypothetical protein SAMN04488504_102148 [Myxococcus virescens]
MKKELDAFREARTDLIADMQLVELLKQNPAIRDVGPSDTLWDAAFKRVTASRAKYSAAVAALEIAKPDPA